MNMKQQEYLVVSRTAESLRYLKTEKKCITFTNLRSVLTFRTIVLTGGRVKKALKRWQDGKELGTVVQPTLSTSMRLKIRKWVDTNGG